MGTNVDSHASRRPGEIPTLEVRLLGPMTVSRGGVVLSLPPSRKVRALFAYLALAPHPVTRSRLCDLLWDVPQDPRGELRWCLSKIRSLVDDPDRGRVGTQADTIRLDLSGCHVDAVEISCAVAGGHREAFGGASESAERDVCRGVSRRDGDRPQPALRDLADR